MDSSLKRIIFLDCFVDCQREMWRTGLLLCFLSLCACLEEECVLGVVGQPVTLPCFSPELTSFVNVSIEWRRGREVVFRSAWGENGEVQEEGANGASVSAEAAQTGNFSLQLPTVDPREHRMNYSLFIMSQENQTAAVCTVCLRIAASFSPPHLQREEAAQGDKAAFFCQSSGGFPEPAVYWLINYDEEPPEGSVKTQAASLPDSHLYNITSHLTVNVSTVSSVSCTIANQPLNETLTSTNYGVQGSPVVGRASEAMWIFSTALCAVVGAMVVVGVAYQIHLDRISKRKKKEYQSQHANRGYKRRSPYKEETEAMKPERKETDV